MTAPWHLGWLRGVMLVALLTPGASAAASAVATEQAATPSAVVAEFHAALVGMLHSSPDFVARSAALRDVLVATFDVPTIARICLGSTWRTLDTGQREEFIELLTDVVVATYVSRFDRDRGQSFKTLQATEVNPGQWLVRTQIIRAAGAPVPLDYYFRDGRVFNVVADGVSDLAVRRADYNTVIKQSGYTELVAGLRANVAQLRAAFVADNAR